NLDMLSRKSLEVHRQVELPDVGDVHRLLGPDMTREMVTLNQGQTGAPANERPDTPVSRDCKLVTPRIHIVLPPVQRVLKGLRPLTPTLPLLPANTAHLERSRRSNQGSKLRDRVIDRPFHAIDPMGQGDEFLTPRLGGGHQLTEVLDLLDEIDRLAWVARDGRCN